jgi:hypothetical protein
MEAAELETLDRTHAHVRLVVALVLLATIAVLLGRPLLSIPVMAPRDYNEGWNAFFAQRAMTGEYLYPETSSLVTNNYPPLSFYIVGGVGLLLGDNIIAGRWVALAGFLSVALSAGLLVRYLYRSAHAGLFSVLIFVGYVAALHPQYIGMNDPQWLAQAFMTAALLLFLSGPRTTMRISAIAALVVAGGMAKHNLLAVPLSITVWLLLYDRRMLAVWLVVSTIALGGCLAFLYVSYGSEFFDNVLQFPRTYSHELIGIKIRRLLLPMAPLFGVTLVFMRLEPSNPQKHFLLLYLAFSAILGLVFLGGTGVDINVLYDVFVALAVIAGGTAYRIMQRWREKRPRAALEVIVVIMMFLGVLAALPQQLPAAIGASGDLEKRRSAAAADIGYLSSVKGLVMCETIALCYWAGKSFEVDVFALGQKLETGRLPLSAFSNLLDTHHFAAIQINGPGTTVRLPKGANEAMLRNYDPIPNRMGGVFLLPKELRG